MVATAATEAVVASFLILPTQAGVALLEAGEVLAVAAVALVASVVATSVAVVQVAIIKV